MPIYQYPSPSSPLFLKVITHMAVDEPASLKLAKYAEIQGAYEGMDAHRFAASIRLENLKDKKMS